MYKNNSIVLMAPAFNDAGNVGNVIDNVPTDIVDEVVFVNDGSMDNTREVIEEGFRRRGFGTLLNFEKNRGLGPVFKELFAYASAKGFDIGVIVAGDDQDDPRELTKLVHPIVDEGYDLVQGSRYLAGVKEPIPFRRWATTKVYSALFSLVVGQWITDASNGFKAFRIPLLEQIDLTEPWLDVKYGIEQYFLARAIRDGFKVKEAPVTKYFPPNYSKMKMRKDWWILVKPLLMSLRSRRVR